MQRVLGAVAELERMPVADRDRVLVIEVLRKGRVALLRVLAEVVPREDDVLERERPAELRKAAVEDPVLDRVRNQRVTEILQQKDSPRMLVNKAANRLVYGDKHPYGYLTSGTETSNKDMSRDDLMSFWKTTFVPGNSALVLAGDLTPAQARSLAEKYFGGWTGSGKKQVPPAIDNKLAKGLVIMDKPDANQTEVRVVGLGAPRSSPDYVPIQVMNTALGGLFSSRINMNLREKHGYTYGAFSRFEFRHEPGLFAAGGGIRANVTAPAVSELTTLSPFLRSTTPDSVLPALPPLT